ncbi:MAG: TonB-dependent receptor [Gammaproteobacteria bacterium]|nr:TonB-dependent receptor [Gammaproteobacteria bacterium]
MRRRSIVGNACIAALYVVGCGPPAYAQTDEPIEEIQVTATRRPASVSEISAALTIITTEEIARSKLVTDSLAAKPGVFLQQTTPGQGAAIIRGLKGSEVLHIVDGMRLNNAIFRNAPTQYLALVAPGTIDRIEIVRGAPASLYGSDAVGGVVQALSRVPHFESAGSRGEAYVAADTADLANVLRASAEFGDEHLAFLASGEYLETGDRRTGGGERIGPSGYTSKGVRFAMSATPSDTESWLFDVQLARQPATPRVDELVPGFGQTEPSSSEFLFAPSDRLFAHVRHTRDDWLLDASWRFDLGWQRITDDRVSRDYLSDVRSYERNASDLFGVSVNAAGESASGAWVLGAEIYHDDVASSRTEEDIATGAAQDVAPRFPDGSTMDQAAIFGSYSRYLGDRHTLSGGLRFSAIETSLPEAGPVPGIEVSQDDFSADLGWVFDVTAEAQLTANLGLGFRAPNVFDLGTLGNRPGNRYNIPNPDLDSEHITHIDVGARRHGERWQLEVVAFLLHYNDRIASVLTGDTTADGRDVIQSRNVATAEIAGVEFGGKFELTPSLTADVVLNVVRGEQADANGADEPADRIPPLNGRAGLAWRAADDVLVEPYLVFAAPQDRLSERDVQDSRIDPNGTPGWMTANVRITLNLGENWQLAAEIQNLFDQRYRAHGSGIDAVGRNLFVSARAGW